MLLTVTRPKNLIEDLCRVFAIEALSTNTEGEFILKFALEFGPHERYFTTQEGFDEYVLEVIECTISVEGTDIGLEQRLDVPDTWESNFRTSRSRRQSSRNSDLGTGGEVKLTGIKGTVEIGVSENELRSEEIEIEPDDRSLQPMANGRWRLSNGGKPLRGMWLGDRAFSSVSLSGDSDLVSIVIQSSPSQLRLTCNKEITTEQERILKILELEGVRTSESQSIRPPLTLSRFRVLVDIDE